MFVRRAKIQSAGLSSRRRGVCSGKGCHMRRDSVRGGFCQGLLHRYADCIRETHLFREINI